MTDEDRRLTLLTDDRRVVVDDLGDAQPAEARIRCVLEIVDAVIEERPRRRDGLVAARLETLPPGIP